MGESESDASLIISEYHVLVDHLRLSTRRIRHQPDQSRVGGETRSAYAILIVHEVEHEAYFTGPSCIACEIIVVQGLAFAKREDKTLSLASLC